MKEPTIYLQVHRFFKFIAVYVRGKTVYMTPDEAEKLAQCIQEQVANARQYEFGKGPSQTLSMNIPTHK